MRVGEPRAASQQPAREHPPRTCSRLGSSGSEQGNDVLRAVDQRLPLRRGEDPGVQVAQHLVDKRIQQLARVGAIVSYRRFRVLELCDERVPFAAIARGIDSYY